MENTPETINEYEKIPEKYTTKDGALELLQTVIDEFDNSINDINQYLTTSGMVFDSKGLYNDTEQRKVLIPVVGKIEQLFKIIFNALQSVPYVNETKYSAAIRNIYGVVLNAKELLNKAPDSRYSKTNLAIEHDGEENVFAGTSTYEDTVKAVEKLQSTIKGIKIGLEFSE